MTTHSQLVGALIKGMRRAESAWVASIAYGAGLARHVRTGHVTPDNAGKVLTCSRSIPNRSANSG